MSTTLAPAVSIGFDFTAFTPGQAGEITGAGAVYQRQLRRRGILRHSDGHARFDLFGLGSLMTMRALTDRGGPAAARHLAQMAGIGIGWHVLQYRDAYEGHADRVLAWDDAAWPRIEAWQAATALIRGRSDWTEAEAEGEVSRVCGTLDGFNGWALQADWLRTEILRRRQFTRVPIPRFCCWWPTGTAAFQASVDAAFSGAAMDDPRLAGPVVVLDLDRLALLLLIRLKQATGQALVRVEIGGNDDPQRRIAP